MNSGDFERNSELTSFEGLWKGGYFEGDPLDPMSPSGYGSMGYMSILHATYLRCIRPYVTSSSRVLEIGCGRGAWTKAFLPAREVWCLDALSAEHNEFWGYLGDHDHVRYLQVYDFSCSELPQCHFDFLFSFGCFCHISFQATTEYFKNLFSKLRPGALAFVLISDYDKYNKAIELADRFSLAKAVVGDHFLLARVVSKLIGKDRQVRALTMKDQGEDEVPRPGRWYHIGTDRFCSMLETLGYEVIDPDVGVNHRDPMVHFRKPGPSPSP